MNTWQEESSACTAAHSQGSAEPIGRERRSEMSAASSLLTERDGETERGRSPSCQPRFSVTGRAPCSHCFPFLPYLPGSLSKLQDPVTSQCN